MVNTYQEYNNTQMKWGISSGSALFAKTKLIFRERNIIFLKYNLWLLNIYNRPSWYNCIKLYGKFHWSVTSSPPTSHQLTKPWTVICAWPDLDPNHLTLWWYSWKNFSKRSIYEGKHGWKFSGFILNSGFWGWLSIESQPQNAELDRL